MELDPDSIATQRCMHEIAQAAITISAADVAVVRVLSGNALRVIAYAGVDTNEERDLSLNNKFDIVAQSLIQARSHVVFDTDLHPGVNKNESQIVSFAAIPLRYADGPVFGVLKIGFIGRTEIDTHTLKRIEATVAERLRTLLEPKQDLILYVDPGSADKTDIAELLGLISDLYRYVGGSGIDFSIADVRSPEAVL